MICLDSSILTDFHLFQASNLLKMGKFVCKSQEGKVYINGFDEIREQGKELRLREDEKWPAHRKKM